ncbi:MAG TPA: RNA-guided pseudouridylation complex pseudouridine synthase subunit Cbf5 [Thermoplasmata archaeon]|nr:RNA-guided pseudouridylation complex pseudouridine synthase subunit Cbf5 [Thermoplasmata archaeon]
MSDAPPDPVGARIAAGAFLLVDKPRGPSSHQVAAWARDLLGVPRAGHAGTLDPNVSGVLWVGLGPALKLIPLVLEFPKRYVGVVVLHGRVGARELASVFAEFTGPIYQTPPVRSAVRRERRVRTIHRLRLTERDDERLVLDVVADSGTYVRTLAVDLGDALGVGAHLEELRRVGTGPFDEAASVTLLGIADAVARRADGDPAELLTLLHPIEEVWREFPRIVVRDSAASAVAHGAGLASGGILRIERPFGSDARVALVDREGALIATGVARAGSDRIAEVPHGWVVTQTRVFVPPERFPARWNRSGAAREPPTATDAPPPAP